MKMQAAILGSAALIACFLSGCSTTSANHVMAGEDGINKVSLNDADENAGRDRAVQEAHDYCKSKNQEAVFVNDKSTYQGAVDEKTVKGLQKATVASRGPFSLGKYDPRDPIHIVNAGSDYRVEMQFKCK